MALSAGVHARPSLMPALHLLVVPQIGHGWISVLHVPPGQSALVMQPKLAFEPLSHLLDSQFPERAQSPSLQQGVSATSPPPLAQRPVSLTQVPPVHGSDEATVPHPPPPVQLAPSFVPPEQRIAMRSPPFRKIVDLSGTFRLLVEPTTQSPVPEASPESELTTQVLVALPLCEVFGIGNGGPKRHPDAVHWSSAQFALLQLPAVQVPPGVQSAPVVHGPAQSAVVVHVPPRFEVAPCVQRFPPASVGDVGWSVSVLQLQLTLVSDDPMSGTFDGSGTATPAPPKYRPPQFSWKKLGLPSAST